MGSPLRTRARVPCLRPLAMIMGTPAAAAFCAACSLVAMPPTAPAPVPFQTRRVTSAVTASTVSITRASRSVAGSPVYSPSTSVSSTRRSASMREATSALRLSLSPTLISSTATVSFSLTMGSTPKRSSASSVLRALR